MLMIDVVVIGLSGFDRRAPLGDRETSPLTISYISSAVFVRVCVSLSRAFRTLHFSRNNSAIVPSEVEGPLHSKVCFRFGCVRNLSVASFV